MSSRPKAAPPGRGSSSPGILRFLAIIGVLGLVVPLARGNSTAPYKIGVGIADTTGPSVAIVFMGYAKIDQAGHGIHLRTYSRAFIVDDGQERFVFVSVDSGMIGHDVRAAVIQQLEAKYRDLYGLDNVMISATHTHSSPGGFMMDVLFDISVFGFVKQMFNVLVAGITQSIVNAHNSMTPGRIYRSRGEVHEANINRSPQAYLLNPEDERKKYKYDVDKKLVQVQLRSEDGRALGVINWFAVHPTSMNNTNRLISSDNVGYASIMFEKRMNENAMVGKGPFVAAFASTNLGDVSPNIRGPRCEFSGKKCSEQSTCPGRNERCFASGPGKDMFESTKIIATRIFSEAWRLWGSGQGEEVKGPVRVVHRFVDMPQQKAKFYNASTGKVEKVQGCVPAMGYSFAAGTTDGPGSFAFEQGTTTPNPLWNLLRNFIAAPTAEDIKCHAPKPILLPTGRMRYPYQWQPSIVSTQLALIGNDLVLAGVPGEFTTMSGRRLRNSVREALTQEDLKFEGAEIVVAGLCNIYTDYVTTPEEYQAQRYEGASTAYGPHTLTVYLEQYAELAHLALNGGPRDAGPDPPDMTKERLISLVPPVFFDSPEWNTEFGECVKQPRRVIRPGETVTVRFVAGHPRNNLMTDGSFIYVERLQEDETWRVVATDADWETKFIWERTSVILGSSEVVATWEVPENTEPGEYRIRHTGYYRYIMGQEFPYQGTSNRFQVRAD